MEESSTKKKEGFLGQKIVVIPKNIRNRIKANTLINALYIASIGFYPHATHHFRERKEGAGEFILIYCVEGAGNITIGDQKFRLKPNHFFIIPPDTPHRYKADENDPWSIYWVHFTGPDAEKLYLRYLRNKESRSVHVPFQKSRINFFEHIVGILEKGYSRNNLEYVNITLWQLLSSFTYSNFFQEFGQQTNEPNLISEAIDYMQDSIDQSITVKELAQHVNYSVSYFHSTFKEKTGFSPIHYFNQLKIQKACQYLSFTDLSIKEISYKLGFSDPFYFSRLFKKLMSLSPSKYRQIYKN